MISYKLQSALFCFALAGFLLFIYREKLKFDPPVGQILMAFRLGFLGAASVFVTVGFLAIGLWDLFDGWLRTLFIYVMFIEILITFVGVVLRFVASSNGKK